MYDFSTIIPRDRTTSVKWHHIEQDMGEQYDDVLALSIADMEFATAPSIVDAIVHAAKHDILGYEQPSMQYYDALASWMSTYHHFEIEQQWVSVTTGVMPSINAAVRALTKPGDAMIVQTPVYPPFFDVARNNNLRLLDNQLLLEKKRYRIDFDDLERKAADPNVTVLLICNPHNPVGRVWHAEELRRMADICVRHNVTLLCDEIHADFVPHASSLTMLGSLGEQYAANTIEFTAPTKTFNIAGLPCANVIIRDPKLKQAFDIAVARDGASHVSHFSLVACLAGYTKTRPWFDELLTVIASNVELMKQFADQQHGVELIEAEGTYLAWLDCRGLGLSPERLCKVMRYDARVYADEGTMFGAAGAGFERINLACPPTMLEQALQGMSRAFQPYAKRS